MLTEQNRVAKRLSLLIYFILSGKCLTRERVDRLCATHGAARSVVALDWLVVLAVVVGHDGARPSGTGFELLEAESARASQHVVLRVEHRGEVGETTRFRV